MANREENLKKINEQLEKLDDEQLEQVAGGARFGLGTGWGRARKIQEERERKAREEQEAKKFVEYIPYTGEIIVRCNPLKPDTDYKIEPDGGGGADGGWGD